jgi:16S rRNA A1518/A1519 N6-dimethyltransferase RsmA/KsgA/DIM1 with predicted DNA glycosylase/AP lyase activity
VLIVPPKSSATAWHRVLEIGCGTGQATFPLAERGLAVTAIELDPELARLAWPL